MSPFFAKHSDPTPKPILRRLLPMVSTVIVALVIGGLYLLIKQERDLLSETTRTRSAAVGRELALDLENQSHALTAALQAIVATPSVKEALSTGRTDGLLEIWLPVFEELRQRTQVTHFYFHSKAQVCLLRIHKPDKHGDLIDRFTMRQAALTGMLVTGVELGPLGTFALRAVQPVFDNGVLLGYVELGKEIEDVISARHQETDLELAVTIRKEILNRSAWEQSMRGLGRTPAWDCLPDDAVTYVSLDSLHHFLQLCADKARRARAGGWEVGLDGRSWHACVQPLHDASGAEVGKIFIFLDITANKAMLARSLVLGGATAVVVVVVLLGFMYILLRDTDRGIQAQQSELRSSQEYLAATLRSIGDGVITCDADGRVVWLNPVAEELTGWLAQDARERSMSEVLPLVHTRTREPVEGPVGSALRDDRVVELAASTTLIARDGKERQIADSCAPIHDQDGSIIGAVLVFRDITPQAQADDYREITGHVLQIINEPKPLAETLQAVVSIIRSGTGCEAVGCRLQNGIDFPYFVQEGFSSKHLDAEASIVLCDPDGTPCRNRDGSVQLACTCGLVLSGGTDPSSPLFTPGGSFWTNDASLLLEIPASQDPRQSPRNLCIHEGYASFVLVPIRTRDRIIGLLQLNDRRKNFFSPTAIEQLEGIAAHIGETLMRRQAEEALRESEQRLRAITGSAQDAILMMDAGGRISYWNPAAERILGYAAKEAIGHNLHRLLAPERYHADHHQAFLHFVRTGKGGAIGKTVELSAQRKDGVEIAVALSLSAVEVGEEWHAVGILRDITAQKVVEQVLRDTNEQLELATARANEMAARAEIANAAKSEFLANMSHEIRTPMSAIVGYADLLGETCTDDPREEVTEAVRAIQRNSKHLLEIINDVLDLSKIEADQVATERVSCSLPELLAEVDSLVRNRAQGKGLRFQIAGVGKLPERIETDPLRLRQILLNLLGNAIKFTQAGSVTMQVSFVGGPNARVQFDVIDTGIGMTAQQAERIFHPFSQADTSTTRQFGGTGLGLTISRQLAVLLGGDVVLQESQPGCGSRFRATVAAGRWEGVCPLTPVAGPIPAEEADEDAHHSQVPSRPVLDGMRVLLAEDGIDNQRLISLMLTKAGATVEVVSNGRVAVNKALGAGHQGSAFDVILMDMQMPELDGYAATRQLRTAGYTGPIIALTAHAMSGDREKSLAAGCNAYASKPIERSRLMELIVEQTHSTDRHRPGAGTMHCNPRGPALVSTLGDDPDMADILDMFVTELPQRITDLLRAFEQEDRERVGQLAHQLKGSAGGYGFPAITQAAAILEQGLRAGDSHESLARQVQELVALCMNARSRAEPDESSVFG